MGSECPTISGRHRYKIKIKEGNIMLKINGQIKVFAKTKNKKGDKLKKPVFTASVGGRKDEDDEYMNVYMLVNFSKSVGNKMPKVKNKDAVDLNVKEAWISCYKNKDDEVVPTLFINKATVVTADEDDEDDEEDDEDLPILSK